MIKAIIFDVGGVILDLSSKETLNIPTSLSVLFNISTDKARKIWTGYDRKRLLTGKDTPNEFLQIVVKKLKVKKNTKSLLDKWTTLSLKEKDCYNWQLLDYIKDLRENFKVYILSDTVNVAQDDELTRDIKSRFDGYFVSYEQGFIKPDKEVFVNILSKTNLKPEECIFIDDTFINVISAKRLGITSFLYVNLMQLKNDLSSYLHS